MTAIASEPKKRQQGFAVAAANSTLSQPPATSVASPGFASAAANSSYIDTSYLLDDEMWRTMTVNAEISKTSSRHPPPLALYNNDGNTADTDMEDLSDQMGETKDRQEGQPVGSHYPWDDGLHHLDDWLGLPPWSSAAGIRGTTSVIPRDTNNPPSSSEIHPSSSKAGGLRALPRLDGSPFTESSFSTGESMSSSEQMMSMQSTSNISSASPNSFVLSQPATDKMAYASSTAAPAAASTATKSKRNRSVTSTSTTVAPESVSAILESSRTGRTAASGATSARRAVSANGRADRDVKRPISTERNAINKDSGGGGSIGKAARNKTGKLRRTSIGPATQTVTNDNAKVGKTGLHIDTATAAMTMSTGPQTFGGMPTMAWNASPWPAGMYPPHLPPPHWGHFAPGGISYGAFPPGWPMWGHAPQSMAMHPAWSLPMNSNAVATPTPGCSIPPGWPQTVEATREGSLSPGSGQSISLPMTSSLQSIFSSMRGLHVGAGEAVRKQHHMQGSSAEFDAVSAPFQPTGQSDSWQQAGVSITTKASAATVNQKSPSVAFRSAPQSDGPTTFPWSMEDIAPKGKTELATEYSPESADGNVCPGEHSDDGVAYRMARSISTSPPISGLAIASGKASSAAVSEHSSHHRKPSRSLNRSTSIRGRRLEDVPEGETVLSHKSPSTYSTSGIPTSHSSQSPCRGEVAADTETSGPVSDNKKGKDAVKAGVDGRKKKVGLTHDGDDEDDHLLDGEEEGDDDLDDEDDAPDDAPVASRKPAKGRGSVSGRPVRSEQERRKRRRESHNLVERRRRDTINERIAELASLLPEAMLIDAIAHSQGGGNNSKVVQVAVPEEMLSRLNSAGRHEMGCGSTLDILSLASAPANSETLALAQARPNKGIILRKSVDYIRVLQEFIEQQGKHARMLREEVERVTGLLEESKEVKKLDRHQPIQEQGDGQEEIKRLWPTAVYTPSSHPSGYGHLVKGTSQHDHPPPLAIFPSHNHHQRDEERIATGDDSSPSSSSCYPQLRPGQSPPPTLAEWLAAAAHKGGEQQPSSSTSINAEVGIGDGSE